MWKRVLHLSTFLLLFKKKNLFTIIGYATINYTKQRPYQDEVSEFTHMNRFLNIQFQTVYRS